MSPGDFDGDDRAEFVTSTFAGDVFVVEHVSGDSFAVVWSDSLSSAGRVGAGDVDANGFEEFFVGGTQLEQDGFYHMRIYAYEAVGDNSYEPYFEFNIFPKGYFSVDLYQTADVDNDGQVELLISFKPGILIIKGTGIEHQYALFYYKYVSFADGLSVGDIDADNIPELFVSKFVTGGPMIITQTEVYRLDSMLLDIDGDIEPSPNTFTLYQNYPNPFNSNTTFTYFLKDGSHIELTVFDIDGGEVVNLVNEWQGPGAHTVQWDGRSRKGGGEILATGVYICRLQAGSLSVAKKVILLR
jgi:hypothetical protein